MSDKMGSGVMCGVRKDNVRSAVWCQIRQCQECCVVSDKTGSGVLSGVR